MSREREFLAFGRPSFTDAEIEAVTRVLRSGWVGMGPETLAFEEELAAALGVPHVVCLSSCTAALFLSLRVLGVGPGDEVICPSLTWYSTANVALYLGAEPVFCDVDPETLCVTAETVAAKLTSKTRAVIPVHFGGLPAPVAELRAALPETIVIVEDAAHALGARLEDGKAVGASGNLTCFSFYANKNLSTGDGGAIALHDADIASRLRSLRLHALPVDAWQRYIDRGSVVHDGPAELGYKMNYNDLQASIGRVQLARQPQMQATRLAIAQRYVAELDRLSCGILMQNEIDSPRHARHLFPVRLPSSGLGKSRNEILMALRDRHVGASVHYPPLHRMPLYGGTEPQSLPSTDDVAARLLTLPISSTMTVDDVGFAVAQLGEVLS